MLQPARYSKTKLPVKIPPDEKPVLLHNLQKEGNSVTFLEQALGSVVTKGLREIGEQRLKYPTLTVKETMLKLFAIFLKTENPANTAYMREKYHKKMQKFLEKCTVPIELSELAEEKGKFSLRLDRPSDCVCNRGCRFVSTLRREEKEEGQVAPVQGELLQHARPAVRQDPQRRRERKSRGLLGLHEVNKLRSASVH